MLRPLPLVDGDRIVRMDAMVEGNREGIDAADLPTLRSSLQSMTQLAAY